MANKIVYEDYAVGAIDYAKVDLSLTDQQMQTVVDGSGAHDVDPYDVESIFGDTASEYATFDSYGINLLRTVQVFSAGESAGFVSDRISGSDCSFTNPPKLVIFFEDERHNSKIFSGNGITLHFSDKICTKVRVTYLLSDDTYTDATEYNGLNSKDVYLPKTVQGYKQIQIEFLETETPYQYVKVRKIEFGHSVEITKFKSISYNKKIDFYCSDVPINTLDVSFMYDEDLNMFNSQRILLYHNDELIGTYWASEFERQTNKIYSVTAEDVFSRLDKKMQYDSHSESGYYFQTQKLDFYENDLESNLYVTLAMIKNDVNVDYEFEDGIGTEEGFESGDVFGYKSAGTARSLLAETMFAQQASAKATNDGKFYVYKLGTSIRRDISESSIVGMAIYKKTKAATKVKVVSNMLGAGTTTGSETTLYKGTANGTQDVIIINVAYPTTAPVVYNASGEMIHDGIRATHNYEECPVNNIPGFVGDYDYGNYSGVYRRAYDAIKISVSNYTGKYYVSARRLDLSTFEREQKRNVSEGESVNDVVFDGRAFFARTDAWFNELAARCFNNTGKVNAKVIMNYTENDEEKILDVGDYVSIYTKYSGTKYGTITEINADVGEKDIIGNVVITVWE